MKTSFFRLVIAGVTAAALFVPEASAQRQLGKKKGPTSKIYLAETEGEAQISTGDRIYEAKQATAFDAPGTVIETKENAHNAFVYSNGTGMFVDQDTRVEIDRFVQEPFKPERTTAADAPVEPSLSQSDVFVARGAVGLCTSQMVSGSSMTYGTPHASVNIRGGRVSIATSPTETVIDLLDGDVTVRGGQRDIGGQILRPGERATIRPGSFGQPPVITISQTPREEAKVVDERVAIACNARKTVTFDVIEKKAEFGPEGSGEISSQAAGDGGDGADAEPGAGTEQEIVVRPTVPSQLPSNVVISPDRLTGT